MAIDYWLPEGTDIARTCEDLLDLERRVAALDGVDAVQTLIGGGALRYMLVYGPVAPTPPTASCWCGRTTTRASPPCCRNCKR